MVNCGVSKKIMTLTTLLFFLYQVYKERFDISTYWWNDGVKLNTEKSLADPRGARDVRPISVQFLSFSYSFQQKYCQTRMHSSRMCTVRSSSRLLGVSASVHAGIHTHPLGLGLDTPPPWTE